MANQNAIGPSVGTVLLNLLRVFIYHLIIDQLSPYISHGGSPDGGVMASMTYWVPPALVFCFRIVLEIIFGFIRFSPFRRHFIWGYLLEFGLIALLLCVLNPTILTGGFWDWMVSSRRIAVDYYQYFILWNSFLSFWIVVTAEGLIRGVVWVLKRKNQGNGAGF